MIPAIDIANLKCADKGLLPICMHQGTGLHIQVSPLQHNRSCVFFDRDKQCAVAWRASRAGSNAVGDDKLLRKHLLCCLSILKRHQQNMSMMCARYCCHGIMAHSVACATAKEHNASA